MKLLTKHTDYALAALGAMACEPDRVFTVAELARRLQIPYAFLRVIFRELAQAGLTTAQRGQKGGHRLARSPEKITLGQVLEVFQGPVEWTRCYRQDEECPNRRGCMVRRRLKALERAFQRDFCDCTLAELIH